MFTRVFLSFYFIGSFFCFGLFGQTINCITFKTSHGLGGDASIDNDPCDSNFNYWPELAGIAWTCNSIPCVDRGVFKFDLSAVPLSATIISANLSLYANLNPPNGFGGVAMYGTNNASLLQRIIAPWYLDSVTWCNQPATTTTDQLTLPQSTSFFQNYTNIDILTHVLYWINNPSNNYGFLLRLQTENYYNHMIFSSCNTPDSNLYPTLEICYSINTGINHNTGMPFAAIVCPNVSSGNFIITFNKEIKYFIRIKNLAGQIIASTRGDGKVVNINLTNEAKGIYHALIETKKDLIIKKLVVR